MSEPLSIGALVFDGFEVLDVFGPLEMFGLLPDYFSITIVAEQAGPVRSDQGPEVVSNVTFSNSGNFNLILIPGGAGTRTQVANQLLLDWLSEQAETADYICSVCTGSALLARAGILNGIRATSNKGAFKWVAEQGELVHWVKEARWVEDGNIYTSSGVSAGMDMSLAVIAKIHGFEKANEVAEWAEYEWHKDSTLDPFAKLRGLV